MTSSQEPSVTPSMEQDVRLCQPDDVLCSLIIRLMTTCIPLTVLEAFCCSYSWRLASQMSLLMDLFLRVQEFKGVLSGSTAQLVET